VRNYFGGAPNAWQGGVEFEAAQHKRRLQENALAALIQQHGPQAGDPTAWGQVQGISQREQMFPHQLQAAEAATAGQQAVSQEFGPVAADPQAAQLHEGATDRRRDVLSRGFTALRMVRDQGGNLQNALQQFGTIANRIGMPAEEFMQMQQQILTNPDSLDELHAMFGSRDPSEQARAASGGQAFYDQQTGQMVFGIPMSDGSLRTVDGRFIPAGAYQAQQRLGQTEVRLVQNAHALGLQGRRVSLAEAQAEGWNAPPGHQLYRLPNNEIVASVIEGTDQERSATTRVVERLDTLRDLEFSLGIARSQNESALVDIERVLGYIQEIENTPAALRAGLARLPADSNPYFQVRQSIESLKSNVGIDTLLGIRRGGATLGQVPQQQLQTLMETRGSLRVDRDPAYLKEDLTRLRDEYARLVGNIDRQREQFGQERTRLESAPSPSAVPERVRQQQGGGDMSNLSDEELARLLTGGGG